MSIPTLPKQRGEQHFAFEDVAFTVDVPGHPLDGMTSARVILGELDDPASTNIFWLKVPYGWRSPAHTHMSDYCEVIIEGSLLVGKKWHHAGDVRVVKAGTGYGPLVAGPEGCTAINIFANDFRLVPKGSEAENRVPLPPEQLAQLTRPVNL